MPITSPCNTCVRKRGKSDHCISCRHFYTDLWDNWHRKPSDKVRYETDEDVDATRKGWRDNGNYL